MSKERSREVEALIWAGIMLGAIIGVVAAVFAVGAVVVLIATEGALWLQVTSGVVAILGFFYFVAWLACAPMKDDDV